ncbi:hypothetical protein PhCBS80983_g01669 [Powellomyces hirtus]|uniref:RING-type E3 ubiquitin transferase n=1 Tax=Powellomyces hirtus TaxID=109895 RepID=A0A507EA20_9FUNG|nr:hypothetical protein PhCBS80983_g01669 [Powellomyces hirtus]
MPLHGHFRGAFRFCRIFPFASVFLRTLLCLQLLAVFANSLPSPGFRNPPEPSYGIFAEGKIVVLRNNISCQDRLAAFGPQLPENGLLGFLVSTSNVAPLDDVNNSGCKVINATGLSNWIALVQRGRCSFAQKIRAMQTSGAKAVVVGDNTPHSPLITMFAGENTTDIVIPSVFVALADYELLQHEAEALVGFGRGAEVLLLPNEMDVPLLEILIVTVLSPAAVMLTLYLIWSYRNYLRRQQELAPLAVVLNLPTKTFKAEEAKENDPMQCAICLEDFQDDEVLRILLCKHEYHMACVDR